MGDLNVIEILKLGLPGLVFLLSVLSYRLLAKEQARPSPDARILTSISRFMYVNIGLAVLTAIVAIGERLIFPPPVTNPIFSVSALASGAGLGQGYAAVCTSVPYANRYLLIKDVRTGRAIQVFARSVIPCGQVMQISLAPDDVLNLGWSVGETAAIVEVAPAAPGQMFVL